MIEILFWVSVIFILYTYFGYPILIAIFAQLRTDPTSGDRCDYPSVTMLISAYNEEFVISKKIENCLALEYPKKIQILIVASGSDDHTAEIIRNQESKGIELCYIPEREGKMAAILQGMQNARGDIVVFSDANNFYEAQTILNLMEPFKDPIMGASTGAKTIIQDGKKLSTAEGLYWKYESWIKCNETRFSSCTSAVGEILAIRRNLFSPPPENFHIINDDNFIVMDLIRRGYKVAYVPEARSYESVSSNSEDELTRRTRINAGRYQMIFLSWRFLSFKRPIIIWQVLSHKFFRVLIPFAMICALLTNLTLIIQQPITAIYGVIFSFQVLFYGMACLGNYVKFSGIPGKLFYVPTYLVNSNWAAVNGLFSFLSGKESHIWKRVPRGEGL